MHAPLPTSPAAERNKAHILAQLRVLLPPEGRLLEIASGTGQHAAHCAAGLPGWTWQASDPDAHALQAIAAWAANSTAAPRLPSPLQLDVLASPWPDAVHQHAPWNAIYCANMLHIAPWSCCAALMRGSATLLSAAGQLITYGPCLVQGEPTSSGNAAFDADLRARNPAWGLRWLHEIQAEAQAVGLQLVQRIAMPANNQMLVFDRQTATGSVA